MNKPNFKGYSVEEYELVSQMSEIRDLLKINKKLYEGHEIFVCEGNVVGRWEKIQEVCANVDPNDPGFVAYARYTPFDEQNPCSMEYGAFHGIRSFPGRKVIYRLIREQ